MEIIRPILPGDREKILDLMRRRGVFNRAELLVARELIDETLSRPERGDYQIYCASVGGDRVAGYICFGQIPMTDGCYDLYWIAVDDTCGRKGLGGRLVAHMEETVKATGGRHIYIETSSTPPYEPARSFYVKQGYSLIATIRDFYRIGDHKQIYLKRVDGRHPVEERDPG